MLTHNACRMDSENLVQPRLCPTLRQYSQLRGRVCIYGLLYVNLQPLTKYHIHSYRFGLSVLHVDAREVIPTAANYNSDSDSAFDQTDIHRVDTIDVFTRFGTSPTLGLKSTTAERRSKDGKNTISKPPTQYWKKGMNYIFGGFNFLMWIAFIVTLVSPPSNKTQDLHTHTLASF